MNNFRTKIQISIVVMNNAKTDFKLINAFNLTKRSSIPQNSSIHDKLLFILAQLPKIK